MDEAEDLTKSRVKNFMQGNSYEVNPVETLKMVAGSSVFGEPSYYQPSHVKQRYLDSLLPFGLSFDLDDFENTTEVFNRVIDLALSYDFKATLDLAVELRHNYFMRLNPNIILVKACMHRKRVAFTNEFGSYLRQVGSKIILRPDDVVAQLDLYLFLNGSKKGLPNVLKRIWQDRLTSFSRYQLNKYKSNLLIDAARISHANNELIDELLTTGTIEVSDQEKTWENLRSEGYTWPQILEATYVPHMALLRNLRNIFKQEKSQSKEHADSSIENESAIDPNRKGIDLGIAQSVLTQLSEGVSKGKQFPFRYYTAYTQIQKAEVYHKEHILTALEKCIDAAIYNFPDLKGKSICLCDNSGSAWGAIPSSYGSVTVAIIANLSALITAIRSEEGEVGVFGDRLTTLPVLQNEGILSQLDKINRIGKKQGMSTENGIWLFFDKAIKNKTWYDHIFIYSDMQAGHGNLFGKDSSQYKDYSVNGNYIDVLSLITAYRKEVNPKVNVFSVQVAGYKNTAVPENHYRTSILSGWTGNEVTYAKYINDIWDQADI